MRARNREINIFNMSLLDILCGALGAFCFMMIVLLPYYKPGSPDDARNQQKIDETFKDIKDLQEKIKDAALAKELAAMIEKLKAQIKELEGRVNNLTDQNKQLQGQVADLNAKNKQLDAENKRLGKLQLREPFVVSVTTAQVFNTGFTGSVTLYVWNDNTAEDGKSTQPRFDPSQERQPPYWTGDQTFYTTGPSPTTTWVVRDVNPGMTWKIYAGLQLFATDKANPGRKIPVKLAEPMELLTIVSSENGGEVSPPNATITPEHPWILVGMVTTDKADNAKATVRAATAAERAEDWKAFGGK